jgi:CDGSH-type Zn-finger protein
VSEPPVEIKVRDDGPYKITGPARIIDVEGQSFAVAAGEAVALCRCGHSQRKPFCDGSHRDAGFRSQVRAVAP